MAWVSKFKVVLFLFTSFLLMSVAHADMGLLISVRDSLKEPLWDKQLCEQMYSVIDENRSSEPVTCLLTQHNDTIDVRLKALRKSGEYHTHLSVYRAGNGQILMRVFQWLADDATDFESAEFKIDSPDKEKQIQSVLTYTKNWSTYRNNRYLLKAHLMMQGAPQSKEVAYDSRSGGMIDLLTGEPVSWSKAYDMYMHENDDQKRYLRTGLEITAMLGFGLAIYYRNIASNKLDHDYKGFWDGVKQKFKGDADKEDDNATNANVGHVLAGWQYFQAARNGGFNFYQSALVSIASSAVWEFFLEYKEVMSINDMIFTGWSGAIVGEVFYQMSRALLNKSNNFATKLLATALNPVSYLNDKLNGWQGYPKQRPKVGDLDLEQIAQFEFATMAGVQKFSDDARNKTWGVSLKGEVINIPDWDQPGRSREFYFESPVADFELSRTGGKFGTEDFKLLAQLVLMGVFDKKIVESNDGLKGYEVLIGLSSGFELDQKRSNPLSYEESTQPQKDMWARAHVLGGTVKASGFYKGIRFDIEMRVHADYVMVSSYALEQLDQAEDNRDALKSVLKKRGYYFGMGVSAYAAAAVSYKGWKFGWFQDRVNVSDSSFPHRFEDEITKDYGYSDQRVKNEIYINRRITKKLKLEIALINIKRMGTISDLYRKDTSERRVESRLIYVW